MSDDFEASVARVLEALQKNPKLMRAVADRLRNLAPHTRSRIEECSLFNSGHEWADGYSRIYCTCGWVSVEDRQRLNLTRMLDDHISQAEREAKELQATLRAQIERDEWAF